MKKSVFLLSMFIVFLIGKTSSANTITFNLNYEFSGGQSPSGSPPWLIAIFKDIPSNSYA